MVSIKVNDYFNGKILDLVFENIANNLFFFYLVNLTKEFSLVSAKSSWLGVENKKFRFEYSLTIFPQVCVYSSTSFADILPSLSCLMKTNLLSLCLSAN